MSKAAKKPAPAPVAKKVAGPTPDFSPKRGKIVINVHKSIKRVMDRAFQKSMKAVLVEVEKRRRSGGYREVAGASFGSGGD